jgi:MATE family multidrug resistance protein
MSVQTQSPHGSYREVILLAYPVVFNTLATTLMGLVDTLFMGWVSTPAQGAVGLGSILTWTFASFFIGTLTVINTFVAQTFGAGQPKTCGAIAWHGMLIALVFSLLLIGLSPLVPPLIGVFGAPEQVTSMAASYSMIRVAALPLDLLETSIASFMRGIGDTRTPMKVSLGAVALNVPLNYWLIFGGLGLPAMGPDGAAYATALARGASFVILLALFLRRFMRRTYGTVLPRRWEAGRISAMLRVGLPIGVGWLLEMVIWLVFSAMVSNFGDIPLAAHNIVLQVIHLSFMPGVALSVAATTLVGQRIGARDPYGARRAAFSALKLGMAFMTSMGLIFLAAGGLIAQCFNRDPLVISTARRLFAIAAGFQLFDAMAMVSSGILRGAGDTRWPMVASVLFAWFVFLPLIWLLGFKAGMGVEGTWVGALCYITGLGVLLYARVRSDKWTAYSVLD